MIRNTIRLNALGLAVLMLAGQPPVLADGERFDVGNKTYREECGSCHVAYPPQLLPTASWKEMMASLDRHFGSDASLEPRQAREILDFLVAHAGKRNEITPQGRPVQRITETTWFRHEHDEVPARVWKNPAVKTPANCGACHRKAEAGDYGERSLRLPK